jgi:hypothetical protein
MAMSGLAKPYDHPARQLTADSRTLGVCSICNIPVMGFETGTMSTLRHHGEAFRLAPVGAGDAPAVEEAVQAARNALDRLPPWEITDDDRARVMVEELYAIGALRPRLRSWRRPLRKAA